MTTGESAAQLAAVGYRVFPCHHMGSSGCSCGKAECSSPGKHPMTARGVKEATTDAMRVRFWWKDSHWNVGIACGAGLYVVDCDGDEGVERWHQLQREHGMVETTEVRTGGGGLHVYLQQPARITLRNSASKVAPHIDTRGEGGYVLAPPSNHKSGRAYEWVKTAALAPVPGWLVAMLEPKQHTSKGRAEYRIGGESTAYGRAILHNCLQRVARAGEGQRNHTLAAQAFILGQWIGGGEIAPEGVYELLLDACPDPDQHKSERTAIAQLREGARYPRRKDSAA